MRYLFTLMTCCVALSSAAHAEMWSARLVAIAARSLTQCTYASAVWQFDLAGDVFTATTGSWKMFSIKLPASGEVAEKFSSPSGNRFEILGNARTRELELVNTILGCRWTLVSLK
jgi:hypothetical protein